MTYGYIYGPQMLNFPSSQQEMSLYTHRITKCAYKISKKMDVNGIKINYANTMPKKHKNTIESYLNRCRIKKKCIFAKTKNRSERNMKLVDLIRPKRKLVKVEGILSFVVKGVSFNMVPVEGGTFIMGTKGELTENDRWSMVFEKPAHEVTLSSYYIGQTQVTQALWLAVMGENPSYFNKWGNLNYYSWHQRKYNVDLQRPVEFVTWNQCKQFISKLNEITGKSFRLPTEAEWEYAARGGRKSKGYKFSGSNEIDDVAWFWRNSGKTPFNGNFKWDEMNKDNHRPHAVATKMPNELGLYDMSGNMWEYCSDFFGDYNDSPQINPKGPESGDVHVCRGGSWFSNPISCRVTNRDNFLNEGKNYIGLRLAL